MRIKTLKMLVELVELGSYLAVAAKLNLSQPAVSMQIKLLEETFGTELVVKEAGAIKLTPAGKVVYHKAKEIIAIWDKADLEVQQYRGTAYRRLTIGASTIPSIYLLPVPISRFCERFPQVEITMEVGDSLAISEQLAAKELDLAVVGSKPPGNRFKIQTVAEDSLVLIFPRGSKLAERDLLNIKDLRAERMIIREEGSGTRSALLNALQQAGLPRTVLNISACLGSTEAIIAAVEAGLGVSFVSELAARKAVNNGRVALARLADLEISRRFYLIYYQERETELLLQSFINYLR